jgi:hypothetical protein
MTEQSVARGLPTSSLTISYCLYVCAHTHTHTHTLEGHDQHGWTCYHDTPCTSDPICSVLSIPSCDTADCTVYSIVRGGAGTSASSDICEVGSPGIENSLCCVN